MSRVETHKREATEAYGAAKALAGQPSQAFSCWRIACENYIDRVLALVGSHPRRDGSRLTILESLAKANSQFEPLYDAWNAIRLNSLPSNYAAAAQKLEEICDGLTPTLLPLEEILRPRVVRSSGP